MKSDREKALNYVKNMLKPGDHFSSKDLSHIIDRQKSETLRVVNWLLDNGYILKTGNGPATSYLVITEGERQRELESRTSEPQENVFQSFENPRSPQVYQASEDLRPTLKPLDQAFKVIDEDQELKERVNKNNANQAHKFILFQMKMEDLHTKLKLWHSSMSEWNDNLTTSGRPDLINHKTMHYMDGQLDLIEHIMKELK